jgi:hypothetical protein
VDTGADDRHTQSVGPERHVRAAASLRPVRARPGPDGPDVPALCNRAPTPILHRPINQLASVVLPQAFISVNLGR